MSGERRQPGRQPASPAGKAPGPPAEGVPGPPAGKAPGPSGGKVSGPSGGKASGPPPGEGVPGAPVENVSGPELARAVLDAARARRQAARPRPRTGENGDGTESARWRPRGYSGPGPDPRDPQPFGAVLSRLVKARGWQRPAAEATVFGAWERVVGSEIAKHCRPVKLADRELTVEAESTAWATQLRLLAGSLLRRIAAEVGHNVVVKMHIHGPAAPSWNRGPRRVRGRGPRDTYG